MNLSLNLIPFCGRMSDEVGLRWSVQFRRTEKNIGVPWLHIPTALFNLCEDVKSQLRALLPLAYPSLRALRLSVADDQHTLASGLEFEKPPLPTFLFGC
jgi:hypothetical protein